MAKRSQAAKTVAKRTRSTKPAVKKRRRERSRPKNVGVGQGHRQKAAPRKPLPARKLATQNGGSKASRAAVAAPRQSARRPSRPPRPRLHPSPPESRLLRGGRDLRARGPGAAASRLRGRRRLLPGDSRPIPRRTGAPRTRPPVSAGVRTRNRAGSRPARRRRPSGSMPRRSRSIPAITPAPSITCSARSARTPKATTPTTSWRLRSGCGGGPTRRSIICGARSA